MSQAVVDHVSAAVYEIPTDQPEADANEDSELVGPEAQARLQAAMEDGVLKVMSKMGISAVDSYRGAPLFEAVRERRHLKLHHHRDEKLGLVSNLDAIESRMRHSDYGEGVPV